MPSCPGPPDPSGYVHGTSESEQDRLATMNGLLNPLELEAIGLAGDERVLELGAGTGIFARDLALALPRGFVLAIERDPRQLAAAERVRAGHPRLELRRGDALDPPLSPTEWGSFDLAHARFLLEHLSRPLEAVRVLVRALRPGGRVVLVDDDHETLRLWPPAAAFLALWRAYYEHYATRGNDPCIGRRLAALLVEAGARPTRVSELFFGACAATERFEAVIGNLDGVVRGAGDELLAAGRMSSCALDAGLEELSRWALRPDATLWYSLPFAEGVAGAAP